jgi:hypothetical protein
MADTTADALKRAQVQLREGARAHKRSANAHRRAAKGNMQALAEIEAVCKELGITLVTTPIDPERSQDND